MSLTDDDSFGPSISPSLIVGIVIISAAVVIIIAASVFRFYSNKSESVDNDNNNSDIDLFNPNQVRPASQMARMKEVRWINNMYAWERGRQARLEIGELRPTTMFAGNRAGEARDWDEWSVCKNPQQQQGGTATAANPTGDHSGASHFYNVDDPYTPSSQQRFSQAASVLLPHPTNIINPNPNQGGRRDSRLRHSEVPPATMAHHQQQESYPRGRSRMERERDGEEEIHTNIAVVVDVGDSPTPKSSSSNNAGHNLDDLAAGLGVGLGVGPASGHGYGVGYGYGYGHGSAYHAATAAQQTSTKDKETDNGNHEPGSKTKKGGNNGLAAPTIMLAPPPVRR